MESKILIHVTHAGKEHLLIKAVHSEDVRDVLIYRLVNGNSGYFAFQIMDSDNKTGYVEATITPLTIVDMRKHLEKYLITLIENEKWWAEHGKTACIDEEIGHVPPKEPSISALLQTLVPISEEAVLSKINTMCEESLDPETFEKWVEVKASIMATRKAFKKE